MLLNAEHYQRHQNFEYAIGSVAVFQIRSLDVFISEALVSNNFIQTFKL